MLKRFAVIPILFIYALGTICLPMGDFAYMKHLPQMYAHCAEEDPDINPLDFVGEHLLNLCFIIESFEGHEAEEEHEKPHHPSDQVLTYAPVFAPMNSTPQVVTEPVIYFPLEKAGYLLRNEAIVPSGYLSGIFRPPIV